MNCLRVFWHVFFCFSSSFFEALWTDLIMTLPQSQFHILLMKNETFQAMKKKPLSQIMTNTNSMVRLLYQIHKMNRKQVFVNKVCIDCNNCIFNCYISMLCVHCVQYISVFQSLLWFLRVTLALLSIFLLCNLQHASIAQQTIKRQKKIFFPFFFCFIQ